MRAFPVEDPQFWIATLAAALALAWLLRPLLRRVRGKAPSRASRATLTIEGRERSENL